MGCLVAGCRGFRDAPLFSLLHGYIALPTGLLNHVTICRLVGIAMSQNRHISTTKNSLPQRLTYSSLMLRTSAVHPFTASET